MSQIMVIPQEPWEEGLTIDYQTVNAPARGADGTWVAEGQAHSTVFPNLACIDFHALGGTIISKGRTAPSSCHHTCGGANFRPKGRLREGMRSWYANVISAHFLETLQLVLLSNSQRVTSKRCFSYYHLYLNIPGRVSLSFVKALIIHTRSCHIK
ncbi:hypothetical protein BCR43DRAFT_47958 [Syncephalastrum racemosum]|uniref:Uncharacterized protein n=1 Tax=Syncephalastrum racemosum TaxID=13706 RepID=A0A1X2HV83_SYNRA|nr:hypothetical protein BCR43DRAFT_47958 [Syncephalastrum racemosum]